MDKRAALVALGSLVLIAGCGATPSPEQSVATTSTASPPVVGTTGTPGTAVPFEPRVIDLYVADHTAPCTGVAPMTCLVVREDPEAEWDYHYFGIKGFDYEPGYFYHLRVEVTPVENPPIDGSSTSWRLVEIVDKTPV